MGEPATDRGVGYSARSIVDIDEPLTRDQAVREGDDTIVALDLGGEDETVRRVVRVTEVPFTHNGIRP